MYSIDLIQLNGPFILMIYNLLCNRLKHDCLILYSKFNFLTYNYNYIKNHILERHLFVYFKVIS